MMDAYLIHENNCAKTGKEPSTGFIDLLLVLSIHLYLVLCYYSLIRQLVTQGKITRKRQEMLFSHLSSNYDDTMIFH